MAILWIKIITLVCGYYCLIAIEILFATYIKSLSLAVNTANNNDKT